MPRLLAAGCAAEVLTVERVLRRSEMEVQFETLVRSICLQLNRRRLAGRGLERRPVAPRGRPAGPTRGSLEEEEERSPRMHQMSPICS